MNYLVDLEKKVQGIYDEALKPLADHYEYPLPTTAREATGHPTVLMLGNHSSGKSSFINYLLDYQVQKTGLAPVDDGFTVISYGDSEDEFDGQTVVSHPQMPFSALERYGPHFLSHFKVKTRPIDLLRSLNLIDSPGMIDSADASSGRNYDFPSVVRHFATRADLILFFFDPDKPGTTGETMSVFTRALEGMEHKLLIIMNKVDQFENIRDFARAYGALCWNLSKVIRTKDIPHIFNTYLSAHVREAAGDGERIPLKDFDISRDEVVREIERTPARRADNLVTALRDNTRKVVMHSRICSEVSSRLRKTRLQIWGITAAFALAAAAGVWLSFTLQLGWKWAAGIGAILAGLSLLSYWLGMLLFNRQQQALFDGLDAVFENLYAKELRLDDRADLRARWESIKPRVRTSLEAVGPLQMPGVHSIRKQLGRLERAMEEDIPRMRRSLEMARPEPSQPAAAQADAQA